MTVIQTTSRPNWLRAALQIQPGEGRLTALLVSLYAALIMGVVFVQTMAFGLFIATFGPQGLPYSYLAVAILAPLVAVFYLKLSERIPFATLLTLNLGFLIVGCLAFWFGLASPVARWFIFLLPVWFQILINLANLAVWPLAGRLFDMRQGKRLFGLVGSGNWLANIVGGFIVSPLVSWLGTTHLLLLAAGSIVVGLGLLRMIVHDYLSRPVAAPAGPQRRPPAQPKPAPHLWRNRYVVFIFAYTFLWWVGFFFVDNIFYNRAAAQYPDSAQLAGVIGSLLSAIGVVALFTTTLLTSRIIGRYGLWAGFLTEPAIVTVAIAALALSGSLGGPVALLFWLAAFGKLTHVALGFSLSQSATLIVYQPLPDEQRRRVQTMAEGIVQPIAIGVAGIVLLLLTTMLGSGVAELAYGFLVVAAGLFAVTIVLIRGYPIALTQTLAKRQWGGASLALPDQSSAAILRQNLRNPHPGAVIYALNVLEQLEHPSLAAALPELLDHPAPEVRREALQRIERLGLTTASGAVSQRLAAESVPEVKGAALRTLAAIGEVEAFPQVVAALDDPDPHARWGALVGLLRHGGMDGVMAAGQVFNRLVNSPTPAERTLAAHVLGDVGVTHFHQPIGALLHDSDSGVRRAALGAAGKIKHPKLWPAVVEACAFPETARAAGLALAAGGEAAIPEIEAAFARADPPREGLITLARACGRIRGERVVHLLRNKIDFPDGAVRTHILSALTACGYRAANAESVHRQIQTEAAQAAWALAAFADLGDGEPSALLAAALRQALKQTRDRLFFLLSFLYEAQSILRAREALIRGAAAQQAYALEVIDVQLPAGVKGMVLPLLEDLSPAAQSGRLSAAFPQTRQSHPARLQALIAGPEAAWFTAWTRACALYTAGRLSATGCTDAVAAALSASEPLVCEMALWALARLQTPAQKGDSAVLSTIEKVIILKTVSVFSQTPDDVLAEVAALLEEVEAAEGETIFGKGDLGDSLYVIVDGKVRVHDGERLLNDLGERDVFGEMALLDPEPRLASVTAVEPARLFRLAQAPFYELMADQPEVAAGIIRVLTGHLRARVRDLARLDARVRELEQASRPVSA